MTVAELRDALTRVPADTPALVVTDAGVVALAAVVATGDELLVFAEDPAR